MSSHHIAGTILLRCWDDRAVKQLAELPRPVRIEARDDELLPELRCRPDFYRPRSMAIFSIALTLWLCAKCA